MAAEGALTFCTGVHLGRVSTLEQRRCKQVGLQVQVGHPGHEDLGDCSTRFRIIFLLSFFFLEKKKGQQSGFNSNMASSHADTYGLHPVLLEATATLISLGLLLFFFPKDYTHVIVLKSGNSALALKSSCALACCSDLT